MEKQKIAFIAMNYGGPQKLSDVKPYLRNIFKDKAILRAPFFVRLWLSYRIASKRFKKSQNIFAQMGGSSPINQETLAQIKAIEDYIAQYGDISAKGFMIQRYAPPFAKDVMGSLIKYNPDKIILLPMYPQFSTTTTSSSLQDFLKNAPKNLHHKVETIQYFHTDNGWQNYFVDEIAALMNAHGEEFTVLYAAHSIPQAYIDSGDVYEEQVKESLHFIHRQLEQLFDRSIDYRLAWQSKVGKMRWLSPSVEETIMALKETPMIVVPLSFVAENSETLVELDIDMKNIALENGCKNYQRIPTPSSDSRFIEGLAQKIIHMAQS